MTNLDSRKVLAGKARRLMFYVGVLPKGFPTESEEAKLFSFMDLIEVVTQAMGKWIESFNADRSKFEIFVDRYDQVISDVRYQVFISE